MEDALVLKQKEILEKYGNVYYKEWPTDVRKRFENLNNQISEKYKKIGSIWVTLGGPLQTLLTAFIGLWIVWWRHSKSRYTFRFLDWIGVFLALFALREVFNTVSAIVEVFLFGARGFGGDEFRISLSLGFNQWVIPLLTAALGCLISCYVLFKVLPLRYRFSFIIGGLLGGLVGFATWFGFFGPWLFNLKN